MTALEDQIAELLKAAPGDPPMKLDADEMLDVRSPRRGRVLAPLLVAAVVAGIAVAVAFPTGSGHRAHPSGSIDAGPEAARRAAAIARAKETLARAPVPPGAVAGVRRIHTDATASSVRASQDWTTAGSVGRVRAYLSTHPPADLTRGPHDPTLLYYSNHRDTRSLKYEFSASESGVTIHVFAWAVWTPVRPSWSFVRGTVTSVDVTVVRKSHIAALAAPTVRRTLTGDPARRLAELLDWLPAQRPAACHSAGPWDAHTTLLFHTDQQRLEVAIAVNCMNQAGITRQGDHRNVTRVAGVGVSNAALHALGLPPDYGFEPRPTSSPGGPSPDGTSTMSRAAAEAFARQGIHAPESAPTFSRLMTVAAFENAFGEPLGTTVDRSHLMWVVTVHAPVTDDGGPANPPKQRNVYSIAIDATSGLGTVNCPGCNWVTADR